MHGEELPGNRLHLPLAARRGKSHHPTFMPLRTRPNDIRPATELPTPDAREVGPSPRICGGRSCRASTSHIGRRSTTMRVEPLASTIAWGRATNPSTVQRSGTKPATSEGAARACLECGHGRDCARMFISLWRPKCGHT